MFCYQCEQTVKGQGCTVAGVCGKDANTADHQDILLHVAKGLSMYAARAQKLGAKPTKEMNKAMIEALFTTVTNVNFDVAKLETRIHNLVELRRQARELYETAAKAKNIAPEKLDGPATFEPSMDRETMKKQAEEISIPKRQAALGEELTGLEELLTYGLKGMAAYADHAEVLGQESDEVYAFFHEALDLLTKKNITGEELLAYNLKCGTTNLEVMRLLDAANTGAYGNPQPTPVRITPKPGKAILVSGHDLKDLEELLKQTAGKGVNVYTHGEMLPAHGYPNLKKYPHLAGNYGGAWQDQQKEFDAFPGSVLMTTNCIQKPRETYKARIFTSGLVAWPNVEHVTNKDFSPVIKAALAAPGFPADIETKEGKKEILVGFGHNAVLSVADKVIDAVKQGKIKHFFLVGGCDGAKPGRNYYTEFTEKVPRDCVILTLACGKYRFNKHDFGDIGGIPRLLDIGQCNDAYSAIQIAIALANAFGTDVNGLPLSLVLSWYEQKAVVILLTLLALGVKNIRLGPSLPAFVPPQALALLVDKFGIKPITTPEQDLKAILG